MSDEPLVLNTPAAIELYRLCVIRSAMRIYLATGMKANTRYTPKNMRLVVTRRTGKSYPASRRGLQLALTDLNQHIDQLRSQQHDDLDE